MPVVALCALVAHFVQVAYLGVHSFSSPNGPNSPLRGSEGPSTLLLAPTTAAPRLIVGGCQ
eukprot:10300039-Alexandrium_andersonii.AAC.1